MIAIAMNNKLYKYALILVKKPTAANDLGGLSSSILFFPVDIYIKNLLPKCYPKSKETKMPKITANRLKDIKPKKERYFIWDDEIKGFGCRVSPNGKIRYLFCYRLKNDNKYRKITIGDHRFISLEEARKTAYLYKTDVLLEKNPQQTAAREKKRAPGILPTEEHKDNITFLDFWKIFDERYMKRNQKVSTYKSDMSRFKVHIFPFFEKMKLKDIDNKTVVRFLEVSTKESANLVKNALNKAVEWEYLSHNPASKVKIPKSRVMQNFLRDHDLRRLEHHLDLYEDTNPYAVLALKMLLYTGARKNEILQRKWEDIEIENNFIRLKDHKTVSTVGEQVIILNSKAIEALKKLKKHATNPYVFCGKKENQSLKNIDHFWFKLRKEAGLESFRIHDLRHSFASFAIKNGIDLVTVSRLLRHSNIQTTMRYVHLETEHLREKSNKVAEIFK